MAICPERATAFYCAIEHGDQVIYTTAKVAIDRRLLGAAMLAVFLFLDLDRLKCFHNPFQQSPER